MTNKRPPHKTCSSCREVKYFKDFSKNKSKPDGYHNQCKKCRAQYSPPKKVKEKNRQRLRAWNRKKMSGFTQEDYEQKLIEQDGKCAICKTDNPGKMDWCADHCHKTGHKRGLLCRKCNAGLGHFNDDPELITKAIEYLATYSR